MAAKALSLVPLPEPQSDPPATPSAMSAIKKSSKHAVTRNELAIQRSNTKQASIAARSPLALRGAAIARSDRESHRHEYAKEF